MKVIMPVNESRVQHRKLPSICSYWVEGKPRKNLNQVTCPDRESNQVSRLDALTVTPQEQARFRAQESLSALQRKGKRQTKEVVYAAWSSYIQGWPALIQ
ncbi:hypothetical protein ANN_20209 [Periplaneta americana]|uniref:Uncharacterized protein n=1 Tax=Periplaneta americana TaxID=6978 RepID=A0ABQ8SD46_PERAM|nr:hypothetical protein ANN_20209 [Periplaneta americana]